MGVSFTEEQQRVIDTHGCNMLVSASAGSGKNGSIGGAYCKNDK